MKLNKIYSQFYRRIAPKRERNFKIYDILEKEGYTMEFISAYAEQRDNALFILRDILESFTKGPKA